MCVYLTLITSNKSLTHISYKYGEWERERGIRHIELSNVRFVLFHWWVHTTVETTFKTWKKNVNLKKIQKTNYLKHTYLSHILSIYCHFYCGRFWNRIWTIVETSPPPLPLAYNSLFQKCCRPPMNTHCCRSAHLILLLLLLSCPTHGMCLSC